MPYKYGLSLQMFSPIGNALGTGLPWGDLAHHSLGGVIIMENKLTRSLDPVMKRPRFSIRMKANVESLRDLILPLYRIELIANLLHDKSS